MGDLKELDLDKLMEEFNIEEFEDMMHPGTIIRKGEPLESQQGYPEKEPVEEECGVPEEIPAREEVQHIPKGLPPEAIVPQQETATIERPGLLTAVSQNKSLAALGQMEEIMEEARTAIQRIGGADPDLIEAISKMFTAYQAQVDSLNKAELMERRFKMQIEMENLKADLKMKVAGHKNLLDIEKKRALATTVNIQNNLITFDPQRLIGQVIDVMEAEKNHKDQ